VGKETFSNSKLNFWPKQRNRVNLSTGFQRIKFQNKFDSHAN